MSKVEVEQGEVMSPTTTSNSAPAGGKFKRHCARRWWVWLLAVILFLLVIVIIIIFAVIPAVAQKGFDKTKLNVDSITILDPKPDEFQISVRSRITGTSKLAHGKKIESMKVKFYLDDQDPFMYLPLPTVYGSDSIPIEKLNYTNKITDSKSFTTFANTLMSSESFDMNIYGDTKIHLGAIKQKVKYRETVKMKGFNKLAGMAIVKYELATGEYNLAGKVVIPNPTVFTLALGSIPLSIDLNGQYLGNGLIPDCIVSPGLTNEYDFKGNLTAARFLALSAAVRNSTVTLQVKATNVIANGQEIPWLKSPLMAEVINVPIKTTHST